MNPPVSALTLGPAVSAHSCRLSLCLSAFASAAAAVSWFDQSAACFSSNGAPGWVLLKDFAHHRGQLGFELPLKQRRSGYSQTVALAGKGDDSEAVPQLQQKPVLTPRQEASPSKAEPPTLGSHTLPDSSWMSAELSALPKACNATNSDTQVIKVQEHLRGSNFGTKSSSDSIQARFFAQLEAERKLKSCSQRPTENELEDILLSIESSPLPNYSTDDQLDGIPKPFNQLNEYDSVSEKSSDSSSVETETGKIFVGNLPYFVKKESIADFFQQFGLVEKVILIKDNEMPEKSKGYCFIFYGGPDAAVAALKATEFDGVEFHGKLLTVRLDDGRRIKRLKKERTRWINSNGDQGFHSEWHGEREESSINFLRVLHNHPQKCSRVIEAFQKIEKPGQRDFALLVGYYAQRGDKHSARSSFESMRSVGIQPNVHIYTNLVHAYAMAKDMRGAAACIEDMQAEHIYPNQATYNVIISAYGRMGQNDAAERWFQTLKRSNLPLNTAIFTNIIHAHCKAGNMRRVESLVKEMEEAGSEATFWLYNCILVGYANACEETNCINFFRRLKEAGMQPNIVSYGCIINMYTKLHKIGKAVEISKEMQAYGIPHNRKTYSMLINGYLQLNDAANAFSVFEDMMKDDLKPDIVAYNILVNAFCKTKQIARALDLVDRMKKEGKRPTFQTYTTIIDGFIRTGDIKTALEFLGKMKKAGCKPSTTTYNVIMYGLVRDGQMDRAVSMIDEMVLAGITPNERSYTVLMEGYACIGELGSTLKYFKKMKEEGLKADVVSYGTLLKACCKAGEMQSALSVLHKMNSDGIERNVFIYNILLDGWAQRGDMWEAAEVLHQMSKEACRPDIQTYTSFIHACCKAGDMKRAMETVADMRRDGIEPNIKTYTTLVQGWALASHPEKSLAAYQEMKEAGLKPDEAIYHCIMTSLLSRAAVARDTVSAGIKNVVSEMIDQGVSVDAVTATHWVKWLNKLEGNPGELTDLVQRIFPPDWCRALDV